jgi:hypothetical protein
VRSVTLPALLEFIRDITNDESQVHAILLGYDVVRSIVQESRQERVGVGKELPGAHDV